MRELDDHFMRDLLDLKEGKLKSIPELIRRDLTLDFHIRDNQVHIYYRGGKIWDIKKHGQNQYKTSFNTNYCKETIRKIKLENTGQLDIEKWVVSLPPKIASKEDVKKWISAIPFLKQIMDEYFSKKTTAEREYQQHVVNENNNFRTSQGTDYFIVDIEYEKNKGRFDMIAILWPSMGHLRKLPKGYKPKLAFIEMKFGDGALSGSSGIKKHLNDIDKVLEKPENFSNIRKEIQSILCQKRELKLLRSLKENINKIDGISEEKPQFILLLAAHDPESKILHKALNQLSCPKHCDLKIAIANFMGYGLYQEAMYSLDDFLKIFSKQIYSKKQKMM